MEDVKIGSGVPVGPYVNKTAEALAKPYEPGPRGRPDDQPIAEGVAPSGALRASIGTKIDTKLVPYALICYAAAGLNYGADKYSPRNFEKGFPLSSLLMSIERHMRALMNGEEYDSGVNGSQLPHVVMLASSIAMLCENHESGSLEIDIIQRQYGVPHRTVTDTARVAQRIEDAANANR